MRKLQKKNVLVMTLMCAVAVNAFQEGRVLTSNLRPGRNAPVGTTANEWHESARSDKFTGGTIEPTTLAEGDPNIEITVEVPAFRLTLWQQGHEVKTYPIGIGQKEFPLVIGERMAPEVIWNPAWIPPASNWVLETEGIEPGEYIKPDDERNPLGKLKIPLGGGYLIHQAKGTSDLGNLVSHGCVRMLKSDLYDLAEKIMAAHAWPVTKRRIERAKVTSKTLTVTLDEPLPVDINYDTHVVEGGVLRIYPDVYGRRTNTVERLRAELITSRVDTSQVDDDTLREMLNRVNKREMFAVEVASIEAGRALEDGRNLPLIGEPRRRTMKKARRTAR